MMGKLAKSIIELTGAKAGTKYAKSGAKTSASKASKTSQASKASKEPLPKHLYEILACPDDKAELKYTKDYTGLQCQKCSYVYPIKNKIPILLPKQLQKSVKQV